MRLPISWTQELENYRNWKDRFFKDHHESPLSDIDRFYFKGLNYFPANENLRIDTKFHRSFVPEVVTTSISNGTSQLFTKFGFFEFQIDGEIVKIQAYRPVEREENNELFIPFRDKTSGEESYATGRYLNLEIKQNYNDCVVDFNYAYNPFCAYSEHYVCPLAPVENWLNVEIRAGEKKYR